MTTENPCVDAPWQPSATITNLKKRATIFATIRTFFAEREVLEVETPVMCHYSVTDPYVVGIPATFTALGSRFSKELFLQTSPEYGMKRLLAAGSGAIYQITKAFRQGEVGKIHNPEFTMMEWYRPGFDHHRLMDDMDELLQQVLKTPPAERVSYRDLFLRFFNIDPLTISDSDLAAGAKQHGIDNHSPVIERDVWLELLWTQCIEPKVGQTCPLFLYDFPSSQAALAKVRPENPPLASRFEVYFKGVELANGFHELQDADEQERRFLNDQAYRRKHQLPEKSIDHRFLAALKHGLPDCAGVALGIDRLVMLALGCERVADVISFDFDRA